MMTGFRRRGATLIRIVTWIVLPALVSAEPVRLVDTGPSGPVATGLVDWNTQWLAGEFSTSNAWRITRVEGWMVPSGVERFGGPVRINLLSDSGHLPSDPLFSTITSIPGVGPTGWYGQSGLNWTIRPGTFWLSFEALSHTSSGPAFSGTTFAMSGTTARPLANRASAQLLSECNFRERSCWPWALDNSIDLGVRIFAEPAASTSPVPEPSTVLLLLGGLPFIRRGRHLLARSH
jgi:hypothetical protein